MATVSGVWVWNAYPSFGKLSSSSGWYVEQNVNFTCNGSNFSEMTFYGESLMGARNININYDESTVYNRYEDRTGEMTGGWRNEAYRTVDFGSTPQTVSDDFFEYLENYATPPAEPVQTPDWANCFVKTASGNKAVEKVWIKQNGELVQIFGEQELQKTYAFQWNSSSSNWWNNYLHLVLNDTDYNKPPKTFPDLTSGVATPIKLWEEDDKSNMGQGRFALYDSSGQLITPIEFVGANCDSEGYFYLPSYLGEINGTITPPYYENGATVIFEYK